MKTLWTVIFSILLSCSVIHAQDVTSLKKEVMDIHDIAMAKMTHMHELKLGLQDMEKVKGSSPAISEAITDLQQAHNGMMQWMRAYKPPKADAVLEEVMPYLESEKVKIQQVSDAIDASIAEAEKLLK
jgi:hypothetical protein